MLVVSDQLTVSRSDQAVNEVRRFLHGLRSSFVRVQRRIPRVAVVVIRGSGQLGIWGTLTIGVQALIDWSIRVYAQSSPYIHEGE